MLKTILSGRFLFTLFFMLTTFSFSTGFTKANKDVCGDQENMIIFNIAGEYKRVGCSKDPVELEYVIYGMDNCNNAVYKQFYKRDKKTAIIDQQFNLIDIPFGNYKLVIRNASLKSSVNIDIFVKEEDRSFNGNALLFPPNNRTLEPNEITYITFKIGPSSGVGGGVSHWFPP